MGLDETLPQAEGIKKIHLIPEMYRVCPSKLSKRELEDLYFTLLENNLELKKTINGQQDKIRVLSTQVQRMTYTQEKLVSKEMKDRGTATKAVVDEQKDL